MPPSPINLDGFVVFEIVLPYFIAEEINEKFSEFQAAFSLDFELRKSDVHPNKAQIEQTLGIVFAPRTERAQKGKIVILGQFSFPENTSEEEKMELLLLNGNSILYGALRGVFANITGTFHTGVIHLPTFNIKQLVQDKIKTSDSRPKPSPPKNPASSSSAKAPAKKRVKAP